MKIKLLFIQLILCLGAFQGISQCDNFNAEVFALSCSQEGNPSGNVSIQVTGGSLPYSSSDGNEEPQGSGIFEDTDLDVGTYTWTFEDSNGCNVDVTFTIGDECCDFNAEVFALSCSEEGNPSGSVSIQVTGGRPPYSSFDGNEEPQGSGIFEDSDLDVGTYTWTFEDSNGCNVDVTFTIGDECCDFNAEVIGSSCSEEGNPSGNVSIQVTGGRPPYSSFDGNEEPQGSGIFEDSDLDVGTYTWTFEDSNGCNVDVTFTIGDECCDFNAEVFALSCTEEGNPSGNVSIQVTGGSPPYSSFDGNEEPQGSGIFEDTDLDAGTYTWTFEDSNGCSVDVTFTISISPSTQVVEIGGCAPNAYVRVQMTGGVPPYSYPDEFDWVGNGMYLAQGLDGGEYNWTFGDYQGSGVEDYQVCKDRIRVTIPDQLVGTITRVDNCTFRVDLTGGTPPYTSDDDGSQNDQGEFFIDVADDPPENFTEYTFTDHNGCQVTVSTAISFLFCEELLFLTFKPGTVTTFISGVDANIRARASSSCVPIVINVDINGNEVFDAVVGNNGETDPIDISAEDCEFNDEEFLDFCINKCDEVTFRIEAAICPDIPINCDGEAADWRIEVEICTPIEGACVRSRSNNKEESLTQMTQTVELFPNPTSDVLNVNNLNNSDHQFSVLRIVNTAGTTLISKHISEQNQIKLDISSIPSGIYFLELSNDNGNTIIEKFIKI